ncbi:MAG: phosphohydrolase [Fusobacteriaceae bacterium]|jgi:hypothetical protein|nr:phosphohydrolase [Fusobacteriaceae bacterium]
MVAARLKQMFRYFFRRYDSRNDPEVRRVLSEEEFCVFENMDDYDKLHSFSLYRRIKSHPLFEGDLVYHKLALLHDCAKAHSGFAVRLREVALERSGISDHARKGAVLLRGINPALAGLCGRHHDRTDDPKMKEFQRLDDG